MARIIDLRNTDGQLVILGNSLALPTSNAASFAATTPIVAGSMRYNPDYDRLEYLGSNSTNWRAITDVSGSLSDYVAKAGDTMSGSLTLTGSAQIVLPDGTVSAPSLTFSSTPSSGITLSAGSLVFGVGGAARVFVGNASTVFNNKIVAMNGSQSAPGVSFVASATSGLYYDNGSVGLASNGQNVFTFGNSAFTYANHLIPQVDSTYDIGATSYRVRTLYAVTVSGTSSSATYADLAERYAADASYEVGTVLIVGGAAEVTISAIANDTRVAGIVSGNPGFRLNEDAGNDTSHPFVALRGRVPCKVTGSIRKGDLLVTSDVPGHAMAGLAGSGCLVGKALEDFDGAAGVIEVLV